MFAFFLRLYYMLYTLFRSLTSTFSPSRHYLEGTDSYCEGPQRHPAKRLQSHQCRTQSPWKEKEEGEFFFFCSFVLGTVACLEGCDLRVTDGLLLKLGN